MAAVITFLFLVNCALLQKDAMESLALYETVAPKLRVMSPTYCYFLGETVRVMVVQQPLDPGFFQPLTPASSSSNASLDFGLQ